MDFQNDGGFQRQTFKGSWKCNGCGGEITELPFEPAGGKPVYCRDCYKSNKPRRTGGGGGGNFQRRTFQGNWKCSDCGTEITELPFEPSGDTPVYCLDCYRKNKPPRRDFR